MKVLFFGRKRDEYTYKCISHLKGLGFEVDQILSNYRGEKLPEDLGWIKYDYIFCYRSYFILPKVILDNCKYCSINFHPGSPYYPGSGGVNLSLLNNDSEFGVTVHVMDEKVDSGQIIEYRKFKIYDTDNLESLLDRTHNYLFTLFIEFTTDLREQGYTFIQQKIDTNTSTWSKKSTFIKEIDELQIINQDISKSEFFKRLRSINHPDHPLEIRIHNHKFIYKDKI